MSDTIDRLNAALTGRYSIERELGEGGMATVYLADDVKHERKVALKVLKPELAAVMGAERFLTEIKTTANLQHPHILPLHDSGEADGFLYYVMPYIEGETLDDRIAREKQLPVEEAVRIASDVAEALHSAHAQGVIHRDIKPSNILMSQGRPLVADFGIALAVNAAGGGRLTETGLSMGTPYYMSPEQASADRDPSAASDVYSLACVLFEMLVGEPPHTGNTAQAVLAKILTERPRLITDVRDTVPHHVTAAVARALEQLPADRFESAEAFVRALGDPGFTHELPAITPTQTGAVAAPAATPSAGGAAIMRWVPWGVAAAAIAVAVLSLLPEPPESGPPAVRNTISNFVVETAGLGGWRLAMSPDGRTLIAGGAGDQLYMRRMNDTVFAAIPGTTGARNPAISPDNEWLVFNRDGGLFKVQVGGGPVLPVVSQGGVPHWYSEDEIVFSGQNGTAFRVSASGGSPTQLVDQNGGRPHMLPGGRGLVGDGPDGLYVTDLESGEFRLIAPGGSQGRYLSTGHIIYGHRDLQSAFALPFDLNELRETAPPTLVLPSVRIFQGGAVQLAVSENGTLVHATSPGALRTGDERFTWIDLDGARSDLSFEVSNQQVQAPRISPDGSRIAFTDEVRNTVVVLNVSTGETTAIVDPSGSGVDSTGAMMPMWSPDGSSLYVTTPETMYRVPANGSGPAVRLGAAIGPFYDISADESRVVIEDWTGVGEPNLYVGTFDADTLILEPYLRASFHEEAAEISPDGRWLAYLANEGGDHAVWLRSFPTPGDAIRISSGDGEEPVWDPDGSAIYFTAGDRMMRREVTLGEEALLGAETEVFSVAGTRDNIDWRMYDISPDGERFVFVSNADAAFELADEAEDVPGIGHLFLVVNWFEELRERVGGQ